MGYIPLSVFIVEMLHKYSSLTCDPTLSMSYHSLLNIEHEKTGRHRTLSQREGYHTDCVGLDKAMRKTFFRSFSAVVLF